MEDAIKFINRIVRELQADGRLPITPDPTKSDLLVAPWIKRDQILRIAEPYTANGRPLWAISPDDWDKHERKFRASLTPDTSRIITSDAMMDMLAARLEQEYQRIIRE